MMTFIQELTEFIWWLQVEEQLRSPLKNLLSMGSLNQSSEHHQLLNESLISKYQQSYADASKSISTVFGYQSFDDLVPSETNIFDTLKCVDCTYVASNIKDYHLHRKQHLLANSDDPTKQVEINFEPRHCLSVVSEEAKPFVCNVCGKGFGRKSHLTTHLIIHSGEKPFKCPHCSYSAFQKGNLKIHVQTHFGLKPYSCKFCDQKYANKISLKSHLVNNHPSEYREELLKVLVSTTTGN